MGPVQPLGLRSTIIGHFGRSLVLRPSRAVRWIARILSIPCFKTSRHLPMHQPGVVTFDEQGFVTIASKELTDLVVIHPAEHGRIGDLVAVEMKDREHRAVMGGI